MFRFYSENCTKVLWILGIVLCSVIFIPHGTIFGANEDFITTAFVGSDTTPPTVPGSLSAIPVATSQINLSWSTSTDNYLLSGYHVWRDNVQIATTTSATYSDTGLIASTTYSYYVTAYDYFFNESASSTVVSTTTPDTPPAPVTPTTTVATSSSQTGTWFRPLADILSGIEIIPYKDFVMIRYETRNHVRSIIQWGRTTSYELGSLAEGSFSRTHETKIVGLTPGTRYWFAIEGENSIGRYGTMYTGSFTTLPPEDVFPPGNVHNLTATVDGKDVRLSWDNPEDPDLVKVRVVRNSNFFPSDIADGWVVYEGLDTRIRDEDAFTTEEIQYYTVFTYDALGNVSSGAVVSVLSDGEVVLPNPDPEKNEISLTFNDIEFYQEDVRAPGEGETVSIDGAKQLTISIPYERFPEHLKTILITIARGAQEQQKFTFLLRANKDKTAYTGTLAPLGMAGNFPVTVTVFDFKTSQIGYTHGTIISHIDPIHSESDGGIFGFLVMEGMSYLIWFVMLLALLLLISRRLIHAH